MSADDRYALILGICYFGFITVLCIGAYVAMRIPPKAQRQARRIIRQANKHH